MRRDFGREAVVEAIRQRAGRDHACLVSIPTLAEEAGLSIEGVRQALRRAVAEHEIEVEPQGPNRVHRYRIVNGARNARTALLRKPSRTAQQSGKRALRPPPNVGQTPPSDLPPSNWPPRSTAGKCPTGTREVLQGDLLDAWGLLQPSEPSPLQLPSTAPRPSRLPARERTRKPPPNAELFAAIRDCWLGEDAAVTRSAGSLIGRAARELAAAYQATPEQVAERWAELERRYDEPTPAALEKHWSTLGRPVRVAQRGGTRGQVAGDVARIMSLPRRTPTEGES